MRPKRKSLNSGRGRTGGRKAYRSPKLTAYGDVRRMTDAANTAHPNPDGGTYLTFTKT